MARLFSYHCAKLLDNGQEPMVDASIAKMMNTEWMREIGVKAIQIMGGDGLTKFYPAERMLREGKIGEIVAGTSEVQKMIIYRMTMQKRGFLDLKHHFKIHETLGVPIITAEPSPWQGKDVNKENILKILAEDYKTNPGLYMTPDDLKSFIKGSRKKIVETVLELEQDGLIVTLKHPKSQKLLLAKANYQGLKKAYPKEFYRWFPDWVKEDEFIMNMTKF